jgi:hypothetical protein
VAGSSDTGKPIHAFIAGPEGEEFPTMMILNAIHPGEPCGVDASVLFIEELLRTDSKVLDKLRIAIVPMYNIGGALNRGCCIRANQDGPIEQGFRGNSKYLDLNRDFMKMDSRNSEAFVKLFHQLKPAILVDTHTSNGADYQHTMTVIHSHLDMVAPHLANSYRYSMIPSMYEAMESTYPMAPYVTLRGETPESGIQDFPDWPRYSTGYAALFDCFGFITEAHMLKPYRDRVMATYQFLNALAKYCSEQAQTIRMNQLRAMRDTRKMRSTTLDLELDTSRVDSVRFMGFKHEYRKSEVTGLDRLFYDRSAPWTKNIPHYKNYIRRDTVEIPEYYIVPQAWKEVIQRLQWNQVEMEALEQDTTMVVEVYYIEGFESVDKPYEGHYLHDKVKTRMTKQAVNLYAGDIMIPTRQFAKRYLVQSLEPRAKDSFFAWGFFDSVLQQKEWFSPYVFEDKAAEMLKENPELKAEFEKKREEDESFREDAFSQLLFLYRKSPYYEIGHNRYPVFRLTP